MDKEREWVVSDRQFLHSRSTLSVMYFTKEKQAVPGPIPFVGRASVFLQLPDFENGSPHEAEVQIVARGEMFYVSVLSIYEDPGDHAPEVIGYLTNEAVQLLEPRPEAVASTVRWQVIAPHFKSESCGK